MNIASFDFFQKLTQLIFIEKIILFGSRARHDEEERSDINLAIECPSASVQDWLQVLEIIEQADTLLKIDPVRMDALSQNNLLLQNIKNEGILVYAKNNLSEKTLLSFEQLGKALSRLNQILQRPADDDRANIDASIQRFEFCIELFWKALKRLLADQGKETTYPKEILREAYQGKLIDDERAWLCMLADRNQTSHTYDEELADKIYANIQNHYQVMQTGYNKLIQKYF